MRLFELIQTQTSTSHIDSFDIDKMNKHQQDVSDEYRNKYGKKGTVPNLGAYAYGKDDPEDPHMYDKKSFMPINADDDPYYQYVKAIEPYMDSNPFLPRIYVVNISKDRYGNIVPDYKMEKLKHGTDIDSEMLKTIGYNLFDSEYFSKIIDRMPEFPLRAITAIIKESVRDETYSNKYIKNKLLKQSIDLIRNMLQGGRFSNDIHTENIMFRGTPHGPQLVITDPLED